MTETLVRLLTRLSESGPPALLWGRVAMPYFGPQFDRLLAAGVLVEQAPDETWSTCPNCECDFGCRVIVHINGRYVATCPIDASADTVLEPDDLRSFLIDGRRLVELLVESDPGATILEPIPGLWRIGSTSKGRSIFLTLGRAVVADPSILAVMRRNAAGAPVTLVAPRPPEAPRHGSLAVRAAARRTGGRLMTTFQSHFADHGDPFMPFPDNAPTIDDLPDLSPQAIAELPPELLAILQRELDVRLKHDKAAKARLDGGLVVRYADRAAEERQAAAKDTGTVRFDDGDFIVVADLPKRVDWDQEQLAAMVARIRAAEDDPAQYVDVAYKVPERKYATWPEAIRAGFEPARTVRPGTLKVDLRAPGDDQ